MYAYVYNNGGRTAHEKFAMSINHNDDGTKARLELSINQ